MSLIAQKPFEGRIFYTVEYLNFPDGMEGAEFSLPQQMTLLLSGKSYRMEQPSVLAGDLVWIKQAGVDSIFKTFEFMKKQVLLAHPIASKAPKYRIVELKEERVIAGQECQRLHLQSGTGVSLEAWAWTKYQNPLTDIFPSLVYLPLQFDLDRNGILMRCTANRVVPEPLDQTYFSLPNQAVRISDDVLQRIMN